MNLISFIFNEPTDIVRAKWSTLLSGSRCCSWPARSWMASTISSGPASSLMSWGRQIYFTGNFTALISHYRPMFVFFIYWFIDTLWILCDILSMHDYSRDIMLANAQTDMEVNLQKMQVAKKVRKALIRKQVLKTWKCTPYCMRQGSDGPKGRACGDGPGR